MSRSIRRVERAEWADPLDPAAGGGVESQLRGFARSHPMSVLERRMAGERAMQPVRRYCSYEEEARPDTLGVACGSRRGWRLALSLVKDRYILLAVNHHWTCAASTSPTAGGRMARSHPSMWPGIVLDDLRRSDGCCH